MREREDKPFSIYYAEMQENPFPLADCCWCLSLSNSTSPDSILTVSFLGGKEERLNIWHIQTSQQTSLWNFLKVLIQYSCRLLHI